MHYARHRMDPRLAALLGRLGDAEPAQDIVERLGQLVADAGAAEETVDKVAAVHAFRWLLDRAADGGLPLTASGYLKPDLARDLAEVLPTMDGWMFGVSREVNTQPVLFFRQAAQRLALLRKLKGSLVLTPAGRAVQAEPSRLWDHLRSHLVPDRPEFEAEATVLSLIYLVTGDLDPLSDRDVMLVALERLGWRRRTGEALDSWDVSWVRNDAWAVVGNVGPHHPGDHNVLDRIASPEGRLLVREVLLTEVS